MMNEHENARAHAPRLTGIGEHIFALVLAAVLVAVLFAAGFAVSVIIDALWALA